MRDGLLIATVAETWSSGALRVVVEIGRLSEERDFCLIAARLLFGYCCFSRAVTLTEERRLCWLLRVYLNGGAKLIDLVELRGELFRLSLVLFRKGESERIEL